MKRLPAKSDVLGVGFNFTSYDGVAELVNAWRDKGENHYVTFAPVYSVVMCHRDREMADVTRRASLTLPDGTGNILAAVILGYPHYGRVTAPSVMLDLCDRGRERGYRHYLYGGAEGVCEALTERLGQRYPGLQVVGAYSPPFRPLTEAEDDEIVDLINSAKPDLIWVGLGAPKQEKWMAQHVGRINATAMFGVGATFNWLSGRIKRAPGWMQRLGLEWVYRMLQEPRHCCRRTVTYPWYVGSVCRQRLQRQFGGQSAGGIGAAS